jgi:uncharacterized membrane protein YphA (DoxX/SURF4 family)/quercetin dioxygenase-like cupin family protein
MSTVRTMKERTDDQRSSRAKNVALWALQILTAAAFLMAGFAKLSGQAMMVETFDKVGIGQWFRYVTGGIEVASVILLLIPRLTPVGAALLVCTMTGAVLSHLVLIGGSPVAALVLLCFAAIILWGRFGTLKSWLGKLLALAVPEAQTWKASTTADTRNSSRKLITNSAKEGARIKDGDVFENPVTGERAVVRTGTDQNDGELLVADLYIRPGGAVMGEHVHPALEERFTVLRGRVGFRLSGRTSIAEPGVKLVASPGTPHDWWNAGAEEALVRVEVRPGARFAAFIVNAFGLAQDGKVDQRGMPKLLQLSLFAREFDDVIQFTRPPRTVQRILFGSLAPLARLLGYRGSYPEYSTRGRSNFFA